MRIYKINRDQPNFAARTAQIRDAQWVSHIINSELPHISTTKMVPIISNFMQKNAKLFNLFKPPKNCHQIEALLLQLPKIAKNAEQAGNKEILKYLYSIKSFIKTITKARLHKEEYTLLTDLNKAYGYLYQLKDLHTGNCGEDAIAAELILKLNGIKNATTSRLISVSATDERQRFPIDHLVCAFNPDGSKVEKINKKTIIIDPWIGKADYADNMSLHYQNQCQKYFNTRFSDTGNVKIKFLPAKEEINISEFERQEIAYLYPKLIYKSQNRKFMQK